jgi:nitroreductase
MDTFECIRTRRSIREYQDNKPVLREALEKIVQAGASAATARNIQPWEFVAITSKDILNKIASLADNGKFISGSAACIAVFCSDTKYYLEDGCAATQNMLLAATALGIGSCWVAGDKKPYCRDVAEILNVPPEFKLVSLVSLGDSKSGSGFGPKDTKKLKQILHWEKF